MNKRGQGYVGITSMEMVFLVIFAIVFSYSLMQGVDEQSLNQIKAEDLSLGINSVYLIEGDVNLEYDMGEGIFEVEENNNKIRVYKKRKRSSSNFLKWQEL